MPISRTVSGLVTELSLDHYYPEGLQEGFWTNTSANIADDAETKKEGDASQKVYGTNSPPTYPGRAHYWRTQVSMSAGDRAHVWHKSTDNKHVWSMRLWGQVNGGGPSNPYKDDWPLLFGPKIGVEDWTLYKTNVPDKLWGLDYTQQLISHFIINYGQAYTFADWIDHFVVSKSRYLTVTGLTPGQRVEIYRSSDNTEIADLTCAEGQSQVVADIDNEDYPLYLYFKMYATDGITLIEVTGSYRMCGGDTWYWVPPFGTLEIESTAFIITRQAGSGTPKEATVTATLKTPAGSPAPGKTIYFTTGRGTVTPSSDVTDANGEATTVLTSDTHGIAVVKATWLGDPDIPAAVGFATHHVFYSQEVADSSKKFQFYIEGIEYSYSKGAYSLATASEPQEFSVQIPEWVDTITKRGLVSIYRKGLKEYAGLLTKINRVSSENPQRVLAGTDTKALLETKVVTLKDYYAKTVPYIVDDLLDSYPCGISLGTVGTYATDLTITFADETLVSTISRLCDVIGWLYRVKTDNSLDVKESFGASKPTITFTEGVNLFIASNTEDYTQMSNSLRMRGKETLVSTIHDGASIEDLGLIEDVAFQKSIDVQGTLDIAAAAELARRTGGVIQISADVLDDYDAGSWGIDDWVTLTCDDVDLSGTYKVVKITRDMTDPRFAAVEFANKAAVELADLFDRLKRELKDLSAKTTI